MAVQTQVSVASRTNSPRWFAPAAKPPQHSARFVTAQRNLRCRAFRYAASQEESAEVKRLIPRKKLTQRKLQRTSFARFPPPLLARPESRVFFWSAHASHGNRESLCRRHH